MRLIDADELIVRLETQDYSGAPDTLEDWTPQDMTRAEIADINQMPTIDAVPVVRCKDCRWSYKDESTLVCGYRGFFVNDSFYCADGERKDDDS